MTDRPPLTSACPVETVCVRVCACMVMTELGRGKGEEGEA